VRGFCEYPDSRGGGRAANGAAFFRPADQPRESEMSARPLDRTGRVEGK